MREILFRGKPTEPFKDFLTFRPEHCENGFVFGSLIVNPDGRFYICVHGICSNKSNINNGITTMVEVIPETVGQYIGLKDDNGKKVFEGDILESPVKRIGEKYGNLVLIRDIRKCNFASFVVASYHIIDNIHDNPELETTLYRQKKYNYIWLGE